jgi:AraC family transcriptional regulator
MRIQDQVSELFKIEVQSHGPMELQQNNVTCDRLVINISEPKFVEFKRRGVWERRKYDTGDCGIVPYGQENIIRWFENTKFIIIQIEPKFIQRFLQITDFSLAEHRGITDRVIYDFAMEMKQEMEQGQQQAEMYIQSLAICLSVHLGTKYQASGKSLYAPKGKLSSLQLKQLLEYCNVFLHDDFGINDLAELVHLSPFHFTRLFKNTVGVAPYQFILRMKIDRAKQLMKKGKSPLSQIAYELGFADQAHLSNAFRKVVGISPSQFLRM